MSIAEQVATLEHDLAAALAEIDALTAANAAFASANASLQRDNVALQLEVNDMKHYVDDTRAMADELSQHALRMLRASRRQVGNTPAVRKEDVVELDVVVAPSTVPLPPKAVIEGGKIVGVEFGAPQASGELLTLVGSNSGDSVDAQPNRARMVGGMSPATQMLLDGGPMLVDHEGDLPIFLASKDLPFGPKAQVFG